MDENVANVAVACYLSAQNEIKNEIRKREDAEKNNAIKQHEYDIEVENLRYIHDLEARRAELKAQGQNTYNIDKLLYESYDYEKQLEFLYELVSTNDIGWNLDWCRNEISRREQYKQQKKLEEAKYKKEYCIKSKQRWVSRRIQESRKTRVVATIFCVIFLLCSLLLSGWCIYCSKQSEENYLGYINTSDYCVTLFGSDASELYYIYYDGYNESYTAQLPHAEYKILSYDYDRHSTTYSYSNLILFELQDIKTGQIYNEVRFYSDCQYRGTIGFYSISNIKEDKDKFRGAINILLLSYILLACSVFLMALTFCFAIRAVREIKYLESIDTLHYNTKEDYSIYIMDNNFDNLCKII